MTVAVPPRGLTIGIGANGSSTSNVMVNVRFDVCATWTDLALRHLDDAKARRTAREIPWAGTNEEDKAASLEREFEASMQAIMAAAIALDAFYSLMQTHVQLPPSLVTRWRTKRTARYSQVTEILRRAFHLKPEGTAVLRQNLSEIDGLRDLPVTLTANAEG